MQVTSFSLMDWRGRRCGVEHQDHPDETEWSAHDPGTLGRDQGQAFRPNGPRADYVENRPLAAPFSPGGRDRSSESSFGCHDKKTAASCPPTRSEGKS